MTKRNFNNYSNAKTRRNESKNNNSDSDKNEYYVLRAAVISIALFSIIILVALFFDTSDACG